MVLGTKVAYFSLTSCGEWFSLPVSFFFFAHPFWVPTHTNKEHDHRKTQLSMPRDL